MEQSKDIGQLIEAFLGYRDMLAPVLDSLHSFVGTYQELRTDIDTLKSAFSDDVRTQLKGIADQLADQAAHSADLSAQMDRFLTFGTTYIQSAASLTQRIDEIERKLSGMGELEQKADEQLKKLDTLMAEKRASYNLRDLQRSLDNYNNSVQRVSDFINKDVAGVLADNNSRLDAIRSQSDALLQEVTAERTSVESLSAQFLTNNTLLKGLVERADVNEAYLFDVLDHWAESRGVKIKK